MRKRTSEAVLTPRQQEMAMRVAQGMTNKEIGAALGVTEDTVKSQLRRAFDRTGMGTRIEFALWWREHGFHG